MISFLGHDIDEVTDKSRTHYLIQYITYWWKGKDERPFWNIVIIDTQDACWNYDKANWDYDF